MALNWKTVEQGIRTWVKNASGLSNSAVYFGKQDLTRAAAPFITIKLGDIKPVSGSDDLTWDYDSGATAGAEMIATLNGMREVHLSIQCFTPLANNPAGSNASAYSILSQVQTALGKPSVIAALSSAGVCVYDSIGLREVSTVLDTKFEGRALLECRCYVAESATDTTGYLETVEFTSYMGPPDEGTADDIDI